MTRDVEIRIEISAGERVICEKTMASKFALVPAWGAYDAWKSFGKPNEAVTVRYQSFVFDLKECAYSLTGEVAEAVFTPAQLREEGRVLEDIRKAKYDPAQDEHREADMAYESEKAKALRVAPTEESTNY